MGGCPGIPPTSRCPVASQDRGQGERLLLGPEAQAGAPTLPQTLILPEAQIEALILPEAEALILPEIQIESPTLPETQIQAPKLPATRTEQRLQHCQRGGKKP